MSTETRRVMCARSTMMGIMVYSECSSRFGWQRLWYSSIPRVSGRPREKDSSLYVWLASRLL